MILKYFAFAFVTLIFSLPSFDCEIHGSSLKRTVGPIYEGIKILLDDESYNAQLIWNETAVHVNETLGIVKDSLEALVDYNPAKRLELLKSIVKNPSFLHCYKEYEREIAHFDREFIAKYKMCKNSLDLAIEHLEKETFEEINFIRNASREIENVAEICDVRDLGRKNENPQKIILCVIAKVGQIDQRLFDSTNLILDIIAELAEDTDIDADSCHKYHELKEEFDATYSAILECVKAFGV